MMSCEQIKSWMMDYLYEELSDLQKPLFEEHMQRCADCRKCFPNCRRPRRPWHNGLKRNSHSTCRYH